MFGPDSRIINDYAWIEEHVGALVPLEVVVKFDNECPLSPTDRFFFVDRVQRELRTVEHVKGSTSCVNLMPDLPLASPQFAKYRYLHASPDRQAWRVTAFVIALEHVDYAQMLATIRTRPAASATSPWPASPSTSPASCRSYTKSGGR